MKEGKSTVLPSDTAELAAMLPGGCTVCGATAFFFQDVLWSELIEEWQLNPEEVRYINIQQGFSCSNCNNNLRSMTLARAICHARHHSGTLDGWAASPAASECKILEINEAGFLTKHLSVVPGHVLVAYPDADIHALKYGVHRADDRRKTEPLAQRACRFLPWRILRPAFRLYRRNRIWRRRTMFYSRGRFFVAGDTCGYLPGEHCIFRAKIA
jgi:hypothetical protein